MTNSRLIYYSDAAVLYATEGGAQLHFYAPVGDMPGTKPAVSVGLDLKTLKQLAERIEEQLRIRQ